MRLLLAGLLLGLAGLVRAEACLIHSKGHQLDVRICQHNRTIPDNLFHKGFCRPHLPGQNVEVSFASQCPAGYFGACRGARVNGTTWQQDIYYYGVASDARYLKPACERQSHGQWFGR